MGSNYDNVQKRSILTVLKDSLKDRPSQEGQYMSENEVLKDSLRDRPSQEGQYMSENEVLKDSLKDRPSQEGQYMSENEVRYKLIIDPSEDDSLIRLLFSLGILDRQNTRMYVCSDFPGDSQIQKVHMYVYHRFCRLSI